MVAGVLCSISSLSKVLFFFKQKTAYEMRISDWSSDVCSSDLLGIPEQAHDLVAESWRRFDRNMIGRFDLSFDGRQPPKMLEYNADTPTSLFEARVVQWEWLQHVRTDADQVNSIPAKLVGAWDGVGIAGGLRFTPGQIGEG